MTYHAQTCESTQKARTSSFLLTNAAATPMKPAKKKWVESSEQHCYDEGASNNWSSDSRPGQALLECMVYAGNVRYAPKKAALDGHRSTVVCKRTDIFKMTNIVCEQMHLYAGNFKRLVTASVSSHATGEERFHPLQRNDTQSLLECASRTRLIAYNYNFCPQHHNLTQ